MRILVVVLTGVALAAPGTAGAKSWITLSGPPAGLEVGDPWDVTVTFPRHPDAGPLPRRPELVFTHLDSYQQRRFSAVRTNARGVFRARIRLPVEGEWTIYVYDRVIGAVTPDPRLNSVVVRSVRERNERRGMFALAAVLGVLGLALFRASARLSR